MVVNLPKLRWHMALLCQTPTGGELTIYADHDCVTKLEAEQMAQKIARDAGFGLIGCEITVAGKADAKAAAPTPALPAPTPAPEPPPPWADVKFFTPVSDKPTIKAMSEEVK